MTGFTFCTEDRPLLLVENAGVVEPCRCGRVFDRGWVRYRHGLPPIDADAVKDALSYLERMGLDIEIDPAMPPDTVRVESRSRAVSPIRAGQMIVNATMDGGWVKPTVRYDMDGDVTSPPG